MNKKPAVKSHCSSSCNGKELHTAALRAQVALAPTVRAAATVRDYDNVVGNLELADLDTELKRQVNSVARDSMEGIEATLVAQLATLDVLFHSLCRRANANRHDLNAFERLFRLALKSQSQSRATAEALGRIKNPQPVAFVKQANIAGGHQMVNNGVSAGAESRKQDTQFTPNKLLEGACDSWMDARAASAAGRVNPALAALEEIDGPEVDGR